MRMKEHLFDKRVVQRALQDGLLDKEVYQRMLDELPDLSHKVQVGGALEEPEAPSAPQSAAGFAAGDGAAQAASVPVAGVAGVAGVPGLPASVPHTASDTLEMERPHIPGSYSPDY
jgi:hypothetical protein